MGIANDVKRYFFKKPNRIEKRDQKTCRKRKPKYLVSIGDLPKDIPDNDQGHLNEHLSYHMNTFEQQ